MNMLNIGCRSAVTSNHAQKTSLFEVPYDYADELNRRKTVSEATYRRVLARWDAIGVVELTALIGYYTMVAMTLNCHDIPLPDGVAPPLPPAP
jgi:hypothetical protein